MTLTADADIADEVDVFGKSASDLQTNIAITGDKITGTLKYVTDFTGFSDNPEEQEGNFLVIHCATDLPGDTITAQLEGSDPIELEEDGLAVFRITDTTKKIIITAERGDETVTKTYSISDLVLQEE